MILQKRCLLTDLLSLHRKVESFSLVEWDLIIRQARSARLLASLNVIVADGRRKNQIPLQPLKHIESIARQAKRTVISTEFELRQIEGVVKDLSYPVIVLKGAAYVARQYDNSVGRLFSDIDILVAKQHVHDLEAKLVGAGWVGEKLHAYDQTYYRKWMHELPPLTNSRTGSSLDLHHNILPETAKIKSDVNLMIKSAMPVDSYQNIYTFAPADMVLHSLTHLFHEGEFDHGLRDLFDVHHLLSQFSTNDAQFWQSLIDRSRELNLMLPLYYGIKYLRYFLSTPIPEFVQTDLQKIKLSNGVMRTTGMMDFFFVRALMPNHSSCDDKYSALARWSLYVRSHYMRMPLYLLIPHLIRKAYMKRIEQNQLQAEEK